MAFRVLFLAPVLVVVLALSACGSSSSGSSSTGSSSTTSSESSMSSSSGPVADAEQRCLDATKDISDATAKSLAEQGCKSLGGNPKVTDALVKAKSKCLEAAGKVPIASLQKQAVDACNRITP